MKKFWTLPAYLILCLALTYPASSQQWLPLNNQPNPNLALGNPLLDPLLADCVDLGARLAQPGGILGRRGFSLCDGLVRSLDGSLGTGAALVEGFAQRALHQQLVCQNKHDKQQSRGYGAYQKCFELLDDFLHGGTGLLRRLVCTSCGMNFLFYQGANRQVNADGADYLESCDCGHEMGN